jgi:hypothetical protein
MYYGIRYEHVKPPRNFVGHETHVVSTTTMDVVSQTNMLGLGQGTSRCGALFKYNFGMYTI